METNERVETEEESKERIRRAVEARDKAMKQIYDYQKRTGVPSQEECEKHFFENETNEAN